MLAKLKTTAGLLSVAAAMTLAAPAGATPASEAHQLVAKAVMAVKSFKANEKSAVFRAYVSKSRGILIVPELLKGGIGIGGEGGKAVMLVKDGKTGQWSNPAFFTVGGASLGPQLGFESAQVAVTVMNDKTLTALLKGDVAVGGEANAAAGKNATGVRSMATVEGENAMRYFVISKGVYAGAVLKGSKLVVDNALNKGFYGKTVSVDDIFSDKKIENAKADALRRQLQGDTKRGSLSRMLGVGGKN
ncbi:MAG: lipid-binding SYLF domain-containing protein [Rhodospirillales bacterium]